MNYDSKWKSVAAESNIHTMRKRVVTSLKNLVLKKKMSWNNEHIISYGTIHQYMEKMIKNGEFCGEMFFRIASELFQRPCYIYPVFRPQRTGALGAKNERTLISPSSGSLENPFYFLYFSEANFHIPHYQSIRPIVQVQNESSSPPPSTTTNIDNKNDSDIPTTPIHQSSKICDSEQSNELIVSFHESYLGTTF